MIESLLVNMLDVFILEADREDCDTSSATSVQPHRAHIGDVLYCP